MHMEGIEVPKVSVDSSFASLLNSCIYKLFKI